MIVWYMSTKCNKNVYVDMLNFIYFYLLGHEYPALNERIIDTFFLPSDHGLCTVYSLRMTGIW